MCCRFNIVQLLAESVLDSRKMDEVEEMLIDNYEHKDASVLYTPVNIAGPGVDESYFEDQFRGCDCDSVCSADCQCVSRSRPLPAKNSLLYECHENCQCDWEKCSNRLVQKGPHPALDIYREPLKGWAVQCKVDLKEGEFVCEYAGEVIGIKEARRRFSSQLKGNFIFSLRETFGSNVVQTFVDPTYIGNIGRYINHSCDPNLVVIAVRTDTAVPKLSLFARRDIAANTELTFDYAGNDSSEPLVLGPSPCFCESPVCRGRLPYDASLS